MLKAEQRPGDARLGRRASSLFYCRTGRCYIFLDLHQDRYLALAADPIDAAGGPGAHPLLQDAVGPPSVDSPAASLVQTSAVPKHKAGFRETRRFLKSTAWAAWRLRRGELQGAVAIVGRRKCEPARERVQAAARVPFDFERARTLVRTFETLRPWFPRNYRCLFDSLALLDFLAAGDLFPTWVFGVQEEPFEAHCWVQAEDVVLNDSLEGVSAFTPIMIV